ncbi:divergent protein kinase domain 2B isoform X3 [Podarcis raffonei]|uniref:divergent protein kinase domain 2B isoform X3 n=1 Tax=Podarcis raffonei TaxID=65483 RepID=UPI00232956C7|nr:divergent protein kinase domain 2B isoform X3 [Podarcis raffonei]
MTDHEIMFFTLRCLPCLTQLSIEWPATMIISSVTMKIFIANYKCSFAEKPSQPQRQPRFNFVLICSSEWNTAAYTGGLSTPMLRCPSQRLLDRIVRRYAEVADAGSVYMDHFTDRDKLRLLYTLSVNAHPIMLQIFPGAEGWPFPKYLGSCGRLIVTTSTRPLKEFYGSSSDVAADLALQLLAIINSMRNNDLNYLFYFTHVDAGTFGAFNNGHLFIRDASTLGVIDKQEGKQLMDGQQEHKDIFSCLVTDCQSELPSCNSIKDTRSLIMVCEELLPKLLKEKFLPPVQEKIDRALSRCADSFLTDQEVIRAAQALEEILKPLQTCDPRFAYRYPDCKYRDKP